MDAAAVLCELLAHLRPADVLIADGEEMRRRR